MPVVYKIDSACRLIRVACTAPLTFAEISEHFRTLRNDPAFSGELDALVDMTSADLLLAGSQLSLVTSDLGALRAKVQFRILAIAASKDAMFGIMRMFAVMASHHFLGIHVFRQVSDAEDWLRTKQAEADLAKGSSA